MGTVASSVISFSLLVVSLFFFGGTAHAEYALCNGKYTNKPCNDTGVAPAVTTTTVPAQTEAAASPASPSTAKPLASKTPDSPPFSERYSIARSIKKASDDKKASGQKGLTPQEVEELRLLCQNANIAYKECKKRADELEADLKKRNSADNTITLQGDK